MPTSGRSVNDHRDSAADTEAVLHGDGVLQDHHRRVLTWHDSRTGDHAGHPDRR